MQKLPCIQCVEMMFSLISIFNKEFYKGFLKGGSVIKRWLFWHLLSKKKYQTLFGLNHLLSCADFFSNLLFSKHSLLNTVRVSNDLGSNQDPRSVGPDLGPNCYCSEGCQQRNGNYGNFLNNKWKNKMFAVSTVNIATTLGTLLAIYIILRPQN